MCLQITKALKLSVEFLDNFRKTEQKWIFKTILREGLYREIKVLIYLQKINCLNKIKADCQIGSEYESQRRQKKCDRGRKSVEIELWIYHFRSADRFTMTILPSVKQLSFTKYGPIHNIPHVTRHGPHVCRYVKMKWTKAPEKTSPLS